MYECRRGISLLAGMQAQCRPPPIMIPPLRRRHRSGARPRHSQQMPSASAASAPSPPSPSPRPPPARGGRMASGLCPRMRRDSTTRGFPSLMVNLLILLFFLYFKSGMFVCPSLLSLDLFPFLCRRLCVCWSRNCPLTVGWIVPIAGVFITRPFRDALAEVSPPDVTLISTRVGAWRVAHDNPFSSQLKE
jgi:hypothetical protein